MPREFVSTACHSKAPLYCTLAVMYVTQSSTVGSHLSNFHSLLAPPDLPRQHEVPEVIQAAIRRVCLATHLDCGEHGFCSVDQSGHLGCICRDDNDKHVYGGVTCERRGEVLPIPSEYIIGLSVGVIVGLLVALVCLVADSYFGCRKKLSGQEDRSVSDDLEADMSTTTSFPPTTSSRDVTQDHISLYMQGGETDDVVQSSPPEPPTSASDVRASPDWTARRSVFPQRVNLPRIPSTHGAGDQPSPSSLLCEETLTQLSDCYYNHNQAKLQEAAGSEWQFDSYRPLDSTYRVLVMGSLGPEPVFLYEPWRNIDKLQFPTEPDPPCEADKLYRSPTFAHRGADQRLHRVRPQPHTGLHPGETPGFRRASCSSSSSDSSDTLVCGASDLVCSWTVTHDDAESPNSDETDAESSSSEETVVLNGDSDSLKETFLLSADASLPAGKSGDQNNSVS